MSTSYITPQRVVTGHLSRFTRRIDRMIATTVPTASLEINGWFNPQLLSFGDREPVQAQFAAGIAWSAVSATFTLWAAGYPAAGYNAITAALSADPSSRLFTASAIIDLTPDAEYPLEPGDYYGEFLIVTSASETVSAHGSVTILAPESQRPPGEVDIGGGLG